MRRPLGLSLALAFSLTTALACSAPAQPQSWNDFYAVTTAGELWRVDKAGQMTSVATVSGASLGLTMSWDNKHVLWSQEGNERNTVTPAVIYAWDGTTNTALYSSHDYFIYELEVADDGAVVFTGGVRGTTPTRGVFRWDGASVTTIATAAQMGADGALNAGLDVNMDTGNLLVANGTLDAGQIYDVALDGTVTSLVQSTPSVTGHTSITQDRATGTIFQATLRRYAAVVGGTQTQITATPLTNPYGLRYTALVADPAWMPASQRRLWGIYQHVIASSNFLTAVSNPASTTGARYAGTPLSSTVTTGTGEMIYRNERHVGSLKTGAGAYTLSFTFPGEAGAPYAVAASVSGYRPGLLLPDGRSIPLVFDLLTPLTLQNAIRPIFDAGPLVLDGAGSANGSIALGQDDLGALLYLVAVTYDANGIVTISEPHVIKV